MSLATVPKHVAHKRMTMHQFIPGVGYIEHGAHPEVPVGTNGGRNCLPPKGTADGTVHLLRSVQHNAAPIRMRWVAAEKAWASLKTATGNRLAWTTDHLSAAGWEYVSADTVSEGKRKRG